MTLLLLTNLKGFSQIDTTKISIKVPIAKLAIKDILKGDGCESELKLTQEKFFKIEEREKEKDSHIFFLKEKDKNNNFMLGKKDEQLRVSNDLTISLQKELKSQRNKTLMWKVGTYVGIITSAYLIITK